MAAVLLPLAVACGGEAAGSGGPPGSGSVGPRDPVVGVDWRVDSVTAHGTTLRAPAAARLRIDVPAKDGKGDGDGRAGGSLGCNLFSAPVTVHGDRIAFGGLRTTRMACDRTRMTFERALARVLERNTLESRAGDGELTLTTGHGERVNLSHNTLG
ncbi:META domain-containing protein [Streptomyces sp. NBC_00820]|uniref:META domain-containing protein n=1 Tax=Streptomyces sp. NBC_00820 TaxID=2975842 RepID=UPI002ECFEEFC|nr:META domain-containing protein [Streptomyces sp. NBC_00820]